MAAVSANDIWAVGYFYYSSGSFFGPHTLIEHWDGSNWSIVGSPGSASWQLNGVAAVSANDVWAVGGG
jgi:hypothetical protein